MNALELDPGILERNLAALSRVDPPLAETIRAAAAEAPDVTPAATRDGQVNFRISTSGGKPAWFGRTSIPLVRANALLERFDPGHGNVLLLGIGQGTEAALLLGRLSKARAVFVFETEPINLLLALRLHDFEPAIADERLVLLTAPAERLADALRQALERRPGHACPARIMVWPFKTPIAADACRITAEEVYRDIESQRARRLETMQAKLSDLPAPPGGEPSIALFSIHTLDETLAYGQQLADAAREAGQLAARSLIQLPGDVHASARATRLADQLEHRPSAALLLDVCRAEIGDVLPDNVPAISWFGHHVPTDERIVDRLGPADRVVAADAAVARQLADNGVAADRITIRPLPAPLPIDADPPDWADRPFDVVVLANLGPTDPESYGHQLPTHVAVWNAAVERLRADIDKFVSTNIDTILDDTERKLQRRIEDPKARQRIAELLAGPVAGGLTWIDLARKLPQELHRKDLSFHAWGHGWTAGANLIHHGPLPRLVERQAICRQAKCALFAHPGGWLGPDLLLAAGSGAAVVWRSHPHDAKPGGFHALLEPGREAVAFDRNRQAAATIAKLLASPDQWRSYVTAAMEACRARHTGAAALRGVLQSCLAG